MPKICIVSSHSIDPPMGIGSHILNISKELISEGFEFTSISRGSLKWTEKQVYQGIEIRKIPYIPLFPFHVDIHGLFLNSFVRKEKFDLIHFHTPIVPTIKYENISKIVTVHTPLKKDIRECLKDDQYTFHATVLRLQSWFSYRLEEILFSHADAVIAVSKNVSTELSEYGLIPEEISIVRNGVDTNRFSPNENIEPISSLISYFGRLALRKGLFELIRSAKILKEQQEDFKMILVGKGPLERELRGLISRYNLKDCVHILGFKSGAELIELYNRSGIIVMPSQYESGPLTLLEGMSCGRPVISTKVGIAEEAIDNGKSGILIPTNDPENLTKSITFLLNDPKKQNIMGKEARNKIVSQFTWRHSAEKLRNIYEKAIENLDRS